jgi:hypothetical protein
MNPRWVIARTSGRAHLDLGERSTRSLRVQAEHIIVTACRAHIDANAPVAPESHNPRCSNCLRVWRANRLGTAPNREQIAS